MVARRGRGAARRCTSAAEGSRSRVAPEACTQSFHPGSEGRTRSGAEEDRREDGSLRHGCGVSQSASEGLSPAGQLGVGSGFGLAVGTPRTRDAVRGSVTSPSSRHCCHNATAPCRASSRIGPREPRHPAAPAPLGSRSPARTRRRRRHSRLSRRSPASRRPILEARGGAQTVLPLAIPWPISVGDGENRFACGGRTLFLTNR